MVSTQDSESCDPSSSLGRTSLFYLFRLGFFMDYLNSRSDWLVTFEVWDIKVAVMDENERIETVPVWTVHIHYSRPSSLIFELHLKWVISMYFETPGHFSFRPSTFNKLGSSSVNQRTAQFYSLVFTIYIFL